MKLNSTLNKYSLITLLTVGLLSSPLLANASKGDHDRHGYQHQQHHDKHPHKYKYSHSGGHREFGHHQNNGHHFGHSKHYSHIYKERHHYYRSHAHHDHHDHQPRVQRHRYETQQYDHPLFFLGWFSTD